MVVCKHCKHENQPHYRFCLGCGRELPRREGDDEPIRIQPVPAPAPGPQRCAHCGFKVGRGDVRCPNCNAPQ